MDGYEENKNMPLLSVSTISALRGSNAERTLILLMYLTFGLVFSAVSMKWTEKSNDNIMSKIELLLLLSSYSAFLIATWNLEKSKNNIANRMHYLSTTVAIIGGPLSFCLNQKWSTLSLIIMIITYCGLFLWLFMSTTISESYDDLKKVHKISLYSLLSEVFVLMSAYSTLILFIYCMAENTIL